MYKFLHANDLIPSQAKISLMLVVISNTALYTSLPILPAYIVQYKQMGATLVSTILSLTLFTSSIFSIFTGPLSDKFGYKIMIVLGLLFRSIGFLGISITDSIQTLIGISLINGLGSAFSRPAISSVLASTSFAVRPMTFIVYNQMLNIGVIIGPIIGIYGLLYIDPKYCFIISGILFAISAILAQTLLAPISKSDAEIRVVSNIKVVFLDKRFTFYCFIAFLGWFLLSQLNVTWSIKAVEKGGNLMCANVLIFFNGLVGMIATHIICKKFIRLKALQLIFLGFLGMVTALTILAIVNKTIFWLLLCIIVYTIAESFLLQGLELKVSEYVTPQTSASYYGIFNFIGGIGGIIGSYSGGYMTFYMSDSTIWYLLGAVGFLGLILTYLLTRIDKTKLQI